MVTKQEQLEWLVSKIVKWPADGAKIPVSIDDAGNPKFYMPWDAFAPWDVMRVDFTHEEWRQERDKMSSKPKQDNSWHERGEFPPAGCECEVLHRGKWIKTVIIGMSPYKSCVYSLIGSGSDYAYDGIANSHFFRPLRTEREKAIEEMSLLAIGCEKYAITQNAAKAVCELLYDAGFRMEKPQ